MKVLKLTLSKLPFEVMVTGEKSIEFRNPSKWIMSRLIGKEYTSVKFTNGYGNDKPYFICEYKGFCEEYSPSKFSYSNGLEVQTKIGTINILLGKIIEKGNLKAGTGS